MLEYTHLSIGVAAALAVNPPDDLLSLVVGIGAGALGGLLPDIDIDTSDSHKKANILTAVAAVLVVAIVISELIFHIGITDLMMKNGDILRIVISALIFTVICAFGKETNHRTFMHSILACVLLTICIGMIFGLAAPYFAAGFISHIAIDMLNKKKVCIFYPLKKGICLRLASSKGAANSALFIVGCVISAVCVVLSIPKIIIPIN